MRRVESMLAVTCLLGLLGVTQSATAAVSRAASAINPGGSAGYVQLTAYTFNTNATDWLTVSSMGVIASFSGTNMTTIHTEWFDFGPIPQGQIVFVYWTWWRNSPPPGTAYTVTGNHRYVEAGVRRNLTTSLALVGVPL